MLAAGRRSHPIGRGFLRSGTERSPARARRRRYARSATLDAVRRTDGHWLRPWEATLRSGHARTYPDVLAVHASRGSTIARTGLIFGVDRWARVSQFSISNVLGCDVDRHARLLDRLRMVRTEAWVPEFASTSSSAKARPASHRGVRASRETSGLWVCVEASASSKACAPLHASVASGRTTFAFFIDTESCHEGGLVRRPGGVDPRSTEPAGHRGCQVMRMG